MRDAACRLHGIFTPHAAARNMLTTHALEQLRVDATKGAAHSSEQHHHADHSCAARRWEKQPAGAQQLGVPWQHDAATATGWTVPTFTPQNTRSQLPFTNAFEFLCRTKCNLMFANVRVRGSRRPVAVRAASLRPEQVCPNITYGRVV